MKEDGSVPAVKDETPFGVIQRRAAMFSKSDLVPDIYKGGNEVLKGPVISMKMAEAEGWLGKSGSKWKTMPELMLMYRAAAFFGRLYAPEILNGMHTVEELPDMTAGAATSLEDSVVVLKEEDGEMKIEDVPSEDQGDEHETLTEGESHDDASALIDPPTETGDSTEAQHNAITKMCKGLGITDEHAICDEVSTILGYNEAVGSLELLDMGCAGNVIEALGAKLDVKHKAEKVKK